MGRLIGRVSDDVAHKLHIAEHFVTKAGLREQIDPHKS
jgi:hypothetical protein